jgi:hypothetical protein
MWSLVSNSLFAWLSLAETRSKLEQADNGYTLNMERQHFPDGGLKNLVAHPSGPLNTLWHGGQLIFDTAGIGIVIGDERQHLPTLIGRRRAASVPIALIGADQRHPQALAAWEGLVRQTDLQLLRWHLQLIATRMIELRAGGWQLRFAPQIEGPSRHTFAGQLQHPQTHTAFFAFPPRLVRRHLKHQLLIVKQQLAALSDQPRQAAAFTITFDDGVDDGPNALTAKMIIACFPDLDIDSVLKLADDVTHQLASDSDRLALIEVLHRYHAALQRQRTCKQYC